MKSAKNTGIKAIHYALKNKPIITSIVSEENMSAVLVSSSNIVFLLTGNIFTLKSIVERI